MTIMEYLFYAAYGSNLLAERFGAYISKPPSSILFPHSEWRIFKGTIYFAGFSERWQSGVAFVNTNTEEMMPYRIYKLTFSQFLELCEGENGLAVANRKHVFSLLNSSKPDDSIKLKFSENHNKYKGKYDTAIVLSRQDEEVVATLTTSKNLTLSNPSDAYVSIIEEGLRESPFSQEYINRYMSKIRVKAFQQSS